MCYLICVFLVALVVVLIVVFFFFFFKQKTAYEMRISDWSSDVCSSDLPPLRGRAPSCQTLASRPHALAFRGGVERRKKSWRTADPSRPREGPPASVGRALREDLACLALRLFPSWRWGPRGTCQ